jgi:hypothetical protein
MRTTLRTRHGSEHRETGPQNWAERRPRRGTLGMRTHVRFNLIKKIWLLKYKINNYIYYLLRG